MNGDMKASREVVGARIHAILARESDTAVVFRRGPSNKTAVLKWDLQTDSLCVERGDLFAKLQSASCEAPKAA